MRRAPSATTALLVTMRWLLVALTVGAVATAGAGPASAAENPAAVCIAAAKLNAQHLPQQVVALLQDVSRPGQPVPCQEELTTATRAVDDAATSAHDAQVAAAAGSWEVARDQAKTALGLDAENAVATAVAAEAADEVPAKTSAQQASDTWQTTKDRYLSPAGEVLVPFLVTLVVLFVAARLLTLVPSVVTPTAGTSASRPFLGFTAVVLCLAAAAIVPFISRHPVGLVLTAVCVGGLGVLASALWLAGRQRIHIEVRGADGRASETRTGHLAALLTELAGEDPRGLEVPRGTDVTALADTPFSGTPEGQLAKLVAMLAKILWGAAPWRVLLEETDDDTLALTVSRNGHQVRSALIERAALGLDVPVSDTEEAGRPDLYRMAAAVVVLELARCHAGFEALGPVTDWRSLGLHYVATTQLTRNRDAQRQVLSKAVRLDTGNLPARVAYLYSLDRSATEPSHLRGYADSLTSLLTELDGLPQVRRRALHSRLSAEINYFYASGRAAQLKKPDPTLKDAAKELLHFYGPLVKEPPPPRNTRPHDLMLSSLPSAAAMLLWAHRWFGDELCTAPYVEALTTWLGRAVGPTDDYQVGCLYATVEPLTQDEAALAIKHLRHAATDADLAAWLDKDPQLNQVMRTPRFREAFGAELRVDFFGLAPVQGYAGRLHSLGVTSAGELLEYSAPQLASALAVAEPVVQRLRRLAVAATFPLAKNKHTGKDNNDYRIELCHEALARDLLPPVPHPRQEDVAALADAIARRCRSAPDREQVRAWLTLTSTAGAGNGLAAGRRISHVSFQRLGPVHVAK